MTRGETLLRRELKREMGSTEPLLEEEIERLNNIINELENEKDRLGSLFYERNEENIRLNNVMNEIYTKALDTSITSLDLRDYIINNLGSDKE